LSRFQNSNLKERGFSYPRKSNSSGGLESPPSVSFESAQGSFEITSIICIYGARPRYGAVGKYGSIAVVERFIKSMKTEHLCRIMVPLNLDEMRYEAGLYMTWYNEHRPHETLKARPPQEVNCNSPPLLRKFPDGGFPPLHGENRSDGVSSPPTKRK
jgi:transposase InsO family protein